MIKILFILTVGALVTSCGNGKKAQADAVWLTMDPVQCLENPWEKEWVREHDYESYPIGNPRHFESPEVKIFKEFMRSQEIQILDVTYKPYPTDMMVCEACSCPAGYNLFVRAPLDAVDQLVNTFGFRKMEGTPDGME